MNKNSITQNEIYGHPFAICTINVEIIDSIVRVSSILGAEQVIIFGWHRDDIHNTRANAFNIPIERIYNDLNCVVTKEVFEKSLDGLGYFPVFIEQGGKDITQISEVIHASKTINRKPCLIIGCGGSTKYWPSTGIPEEFMIDSSYVYEIPQVFIKNSPIKSFPTTSAMSIATWELQKAFQL